jgi:PH (Pleckstrin Homology) domain-containing protein
MRQPVRIRVPVALRVYLAGFGVVWSAFLIATVLHSGVSDALVVLFMIPIGVAIAMRAALQVVVADDSGLFVRNFYRTRRFSWSDVEEFRIGTPAMQPFGKVIHVLLRNGEFFALDVSMRPWFFGRGKAKLEETVTRLRSWLPPESS